MNAHIVKVFPLYARAWL